MATKLARMVIYLVRVWIIKPYKTLNTCSCKVTWQKSFYISITRVPMANKLGRKVTSLDGLLPIMPNEPLDHVTLWDTKFTYRMRFSMQTLKLSLTSCFISSANVNIRFLSLLLLKFRRFSFPRFSFPRISKLMLGE